MVMAMAMAMAAPLPMMEMEMVEPPPMMEMHPMTKMRCSMIAMVIFWCPDDTCMLLFDHVLDGDVDGDGDDVTSCALMQRTRTGMPIQMLYTQPVMIQSISSNLCICIIPLGTHRFGTTYMSSLEA
jgi:hypothetical protein